MTDKKNPRDIAEEILKGITLSATEKESLVIKIKDAIKIERTRQRLQDGKIALLNEKIKLVNLENERIRTVLEFYACDFNWHDVAEPECTEYQCIHNDKGHLARVTLDEPRRDSEKDKC